MPVTHEDVRISFILSELGEQSHREAKPLRVTDHSALKHSPMEDPEK